MRQPILLAVVVGVALLATVSATAGTSSKALRASTSYTDPAGDSGTAADVVGTTVASDTNGQYTFQVAFNSGLTTTHTVALFLDVDVNSSTGDPRAAGADYAIVDNESDETYVFGRWNGSWWERAPGGSSIRVAVATPTELTVSVNRSDLGGSSAFNFWIDSWDRDGGDGHEDIAPDGTATWHYESALQQGPLTLSIVDGAATSPKAGGSWGLMVAVTRSDTGATLGSEGTITCRATGGGKSLRVLTEEFVSGADGGTAAACLFQVPKKLKHKLLSGTVTVSYQGVSVSRTFTARVR